MQSTANLDRAAAAFSLACIVHCIALPVLSVTAPFLSAVAEQEAIHWALTGLAIAASSTVIWSSPTARTRQFLVPAVMGMFFIVSALVAEPFGIEETVPTVIGGLLLAFAHIRRLVSRS